MSQVRVLSENLANRIAAGEVVERPASVVKELVENALDAGASRIEVDLEDGGRKLIRVRDDGHGMAAEDAILAIQRFATSKISSEEDLDTILTMGFRGEALPSIAAVSQFRLQTREPDNPEGAQVAINGGSEPELTVIGCPHGTTVEVRELFYNTPVRLKFLSTSARERGHCVDWVFRLALSRPDVTFRLTHDGDVVFTSSGTGDLRSVLAAVYGSTAAREFIEVDYSVDDIYCSGLISGPKLLRATREHQLFFVNRRFVRSRPVGHALNEAYGLLLPAGKNPLCALHLDVPPERVDPNVHPTKIEVRFIRGGQMHEIVQMAAEEALARAGYRALSQSARHVPRMEEPDAYPPPQQRSDFQPILPAGRIAGPDEEQIGRIQRLRLNPLKDRIDARDEGLGVFDAPVVRITQPRNSDMGQEPDDTIAQTDFWKDTTIRVIGQLGHRFIVAEGPDGLLLINQHRAAERIFLEQMQQGQLARQLLMIPETLKLTPLEAGAIRDDLPLLAELGFELEEFGGDTYLVRSVPVEMVTGSPLETLRTIIGEIAQWERLTDPGHRREKARATVACHASIKAGQHLSMEAMQQLVDKLLKSEAPAICPHGDPIIISLPLDSLDKQFGR